MTEPQTPSTPAPAQPTAPYSPPPGSPLYAEPLSKEETAGVLERLERARRESLELGTRMEKAWTSAEARNIREVVQEDGNVDWREFVKHCGGILNVVALVDEYGLPDTDRIIPKVDELFDRYVQQDRDRGSIFVARPRNRPYVPGRGTAAGEARAAEKRAARDRDPGENDAEALLRQEREKAAQRSTTRSR